MSAAVLNLINQLNPYEETQVLDFVRDLIDKREKVSDNEGLKNFYALREEALRNRPEGMTLDEINEIIRQARAERHAREAIS